MPLDSIGINIPIIAAIFGSIFGALVAFVLFYNHDVSKEKRDIKKIRALINSDFARLYQLAKEDISKIEQDNVEHTLDDYINKITAGDTNIDEFLFEYSKISEFNFWEAIVSSGSLIKLPEKEILLIQGTIDTIQILNIDIKELGEKVERDLRTAIRDSSDSGKDRVNEIMTEFLGDLISFYEAVIDILKVSRSLRWVDLEKKLVKE